MLSGCQAVLFLLLAGHTLADPFPEDSDEGQPLIDRLDEYVENVHSRVIESTGYERLRVVVNTSGEVLEFFKFLGYLLLNGTLGECVDGVQTYIGIRCVIHINQNRSRFRDAVTDFLAEGRDKNVKESEAFPLLVLPEWEFGRDDASRSRLYLKEIFSNTWWFFDLLQDHISEAHPVDDVRLNFYNELPWKCYEYSADVTVPYRINNAISAIVDLVDPNCTSLERGPSSSRSKVYLQEACEQVAVERGFNGGTSNRCLHKFIVRYNNYSAKAYETFVGHVAKYLYWDTVAHGICLSISPFGELVNVTEADLRRAWVLRNLASIGGSLLELNSVFDETPPTYWIVEAKRVMESAIGNETVPYPSPTDAVHLYKRIYDRFQADFRSVAALRIKNLSDCPIDVLVYYPGYDSKEHCYQNFSNVILSGQFSGVNYVVSLRQEHVPSWVTTNNATMERYFRDSQEQDQCERIADVDREMANKLTESDDLRAVVAVKCARKFVWYELGYQYFPAAYTEAPTVRIKQESTYSSNCGILVLFP